MSSTATSACASVLLASCALGLGACAGSPAPAADVVVVAPAAVTAQANAVAPPVPEPRDSGEAYASGISLRQQRPLGSAAVAFAQYLNAMHNRVHPLFADRYLAWLDARPDKTDPIMNPQLVVRVELAVAPDGSITRIGVVRPSGVAAFDAAAVYAFTHAAPFGPTPGETRSADGNLWLQWSVHRDAKIACGTREARPFLLGP